MSELSTLEKFEALAATAMGEIVAASVLAELGALAGCREALVEAEDALTRATDLAQEMEAEAEETEKGG